MMPPETSAALPKRALKKCPIITEMNDKLAEVMAIAAMAVGIDMRIKAKETPAANASMEVTTERKIVSRTLKLRPRSSASRSSCGRHPKSSYRR